MFYDNQGENKMKPNYDITKRITLVNDTCQLLYHLNHFDFMAFDEVNAEFLAISKAIIQSDTDIVWEIVDSLEEDREYIEEDDYTDEEFYKVKRELEKIAEDIKMDEALNNTVDIIKKKINPI